MQDLEELLSDRRDKVHAAANNFFSLFAETVKQRRLELNWSQEDLAMALTLCGVDVTQSYISRLEREKRTVPNLPIIIALATLLSISLDEIISRSQAEDKSADGPGAATR